MTSVGRAKRTAAGVVARYAATHEDYRGAFLTGSVGELADDDELPPTSDIDVAVVVDHPTAKVGKIRRDGVLVEITPVTTAELADPAIVARTFWLAPSFSGGRVLDDPTGILAGLEGAVAPGFASPAARLARVADVEGRIRHLEGVGPGQPWSALVTATVFPSSLPAVMVAVAAGRPPTVRRRYPVAREVLTRAGEPDAYEPLLALLGCERVDASTVSRHLDALEVVFDETSALGVPSAFPFAADLSADARPVTIDGSRDMVDQGDHREAVFWIVATFARCQRVLEQDFPERAGATDPAFRSAVRDLTGLVSPADITERRTRVEASLAGLDQLTARLAHRTNG